jgi:hypothetical protein
MKLSTQGFVCAIRLTNWTIEVDDYALDDFRNSPGTLGVGTCDRSNAKWVHSHSLNSRDRCRATAGHTRSASNMSDQSLFEILRQSG